MGILKLKSLDEFVKRQGLETGIWNGRGMAKPEQDALASGMYLRWFLTIPDNPQCQATRLSSLMSVPKCAAIGIE
jgi:hypothetical protein